MDGCVRKEGCWCTTSSSNSSFRRGNLSRHSGVEALKEESAVTSAILSDSGKCRRVASPLAAGQREAACLRCRCSHLSSGAASTEKSDKQRDAPQRTACTPAARGGPYEEGWADERPTSSSGIAAPAAVESPTLLQQQQGDRVRAQNSSGRRLPQHARPRQLCVCMVSDFFYPSLGGIETHIYTLSQCLLQRGYKVLVLTHFAAPNRQGVRYMLNGLKVYYLPFRPFFENTTFPTGFSFFPLVRNILLRERVDIVHGHQTTSTLAHETMFLARGLGCQVVYTDHSLFGFSDLASIHLNKIVRFSLHDMNACICVSHTHRENFVLRVGLPPSRVHVINNAIDPENLYPDPSRRPRPPQIRIVVLSRLTYRKGIDLLVRVIPLTCKRFPHVQFVIGGDGPKRIILEEMREQHRLYNRVQLLGTISGARVRELLQSGHIFLNTSLTESFCIAIVEAAACGLLVVSTNVGGIPEVLPPHMVLLAEPDSVAVTRQVEQAVAAVHRVDPFALHEQVQRMYSWRNVAARTERVYFSLLFPDLPYPPCCSTAKDAHKRGGANLVACAPGCNCVQQEKKRLLPCCRSCISNSDSTCTPQLQNGNSNEGNSEGQCSPSDSMISESGRSCSTSTVGLANDHSCASSSSSSSKCCCCSSFTGRGRCGCSTTGGSKPEARQHCGSSRCRGSTSSSRGAACEGTCSSAPGSTQGGGDSSDSSDSGEHHAAFCDSEEEEDIEDKYYCTCCNRPPLLCGCVELPPSPPRPPPASAIVQRLRTAYKLGPVSGKIYCVIIIASWIYLLLLEFLFPRHEVEEAPSFPSRMVLQMACVFNGKSKRRGFAEQQQNKQAVVCSEACETADATQGEGSATSCGAAAAVDQLSLHHPGRVETSPEVCCCQCSAGRGSAVAN